jgi:hypothetical protein
VLLKRLSILSIFQTFQTVSAVLRDLQVNAISDSALSVNEFLPRGSLEQLGKDVGYSYGTCLEGIPYIGFMVNFHNFSYSFLSSQKLNNVPGDI